MSDAGSDIFQVETGVEESDIWIRTVGEIDVSTSPKWEKAIVDSLATAPDRIYVDMRRVSFIDSSGLAVLVRCHAMADDQNSHLIIWSPSRTVVRVLELAGLKHHLTIEA
jgi:anti-anti-sigma factor